MNTTTVSLAEITATAIRVLCREIGVVNTARFLNQFTTGLGDYTKERDEILGNPTVEELVTEIERLRDRKTKSSGSGRKSARR